MAARIFQVDAFAERPFEGNPAAVCILESAAPEQWMQSLAAEMNLSETAFVVPGRKRFDLRWFTPAAEVDLCGHATLAAAHVLWETGRRRSWPIAFETRSGELTAVAAGERIQLDFPADPPRAISAPAEIEAALGSPAIWWGSGREYLVAELGSEAEVTALAPDFSALRELVPVGIAVTARSQSGTWDFVSRFFAPAVGIDEDPVTGSAHCLLAPLWAERLGKDDLVGYQASRRGGIVGARSAGDRVLLLGRAVSVLSGTLEFPLPEATPKVQGAGGQLPRGRK